MKKIAQYRMNRVTIAGEMARRFYNIKELSDATNLSRNTVARAIDGRYYVSAKTAAAIAAALNLDFDAAVDEVITAAGVGENEGR